MVLGRNAYTVEASAVAPHETRGQPAGCGQCARATSPGTEQRGRP